MKKGEASAMINSAGKEKITVEEKGKRASYLTRIEMDFDLKISKLRDQGAVDKIPDQLWILFEFRNKIEFCPHNVDVSSTPPKGEGVYMHTRFWHLS